MLTLSKTEETMVTSEKRVSGQRQSPGKGWPQLERGWRVREQPGGKGIWHRRNQRQEEEAALPEGRQTKGSLVHASLLSVPHMPSGSGDEGKKSR